MLEDILNDITKERTRQDEKWGGNQRHPDKSSDYFEYKSFPNTASGMRWLNNKRAEHNNIAWDSILYEELMEAFEEMGEDQDNLRKELIECAAVICAWVEDIDSRNNLAAKIITQPKYECGCPESCASPSALCIPPRKC